MKNKFKTKPLQMQDLVCEFIDKIIILWQTWIESNLTWGSAFNIYFQEFHCYF